MDISHAQQLLNAERTQLVTLLGGVGKHTTVGGNEDWIPTPVDLGGSHADPSDRADEDEEFENRALIEADLEKKLRDIDAALARIASGAYGKCTVCGERIPDERLTINPSAATCVAHA